MTDRWSIVRPIRRDRFQRWQNMSRSANAGKCARTLRRSRHEEDKARVTASDSLPEAGPPDVLQLRDRKTTPKNEVLVRVHASSVNALEWRRFVARLMVHMFVIKTSPSAVTRGGVEAVCAAKQVRQAIGLRSPQRRVRRVFARKKIT
jgi:hypothetical protein